jgi:hypothetical protein
VLEELLISAQDGDEWSVSGCGRSASKETVSIGMAAGRVPNPVSTQAITLTFVTRPP